MRDSYFKSHQLYRFFWDTLADEVDVGEMIIVGRIVDFVFLMGNTKESSIWNHLIDMIFVGFMKGVNSEHYSKRT